MTNPYDTLGIPTLAPLSVAKAAYRRLAQQHHPDRGGSEEKFKAIKAAFEYLNIPVSITLEPGHDPSEPIVVPNRGYGSEERGDLRIKIEPVFKAPSALNQGERQQLARLNEMVK